MFSVSPGPPLRSETVSLSTSPARTTLASTASLESDAHNSGMWHTAPAMLVVPVAIGYSLDLYLNPLLAPFLALLGGRGCILCYCLPSATPLRRRGVLPLAPRGGELGYEVRDEVRVGLGAFGSDVIDAIRELARQHAVIACQRRHRPL